MSFRLAAYAICRDGQRVLLVRAVTPSGAEVWTLPGGEVEHGEDPIDAVVREVGEEVGVTGVVERLLGIDSRVIEASESWGGERHQNVGIFYRVGLGPGAIRSEVNGRTLEPTWIDVDAVAGLRRAAAVEIGLALDRREPVDGHVDPVAVGGLIEH